MILYGTNRAIAIWIEACSVHIPRTQTHLFLWRIIKFYARIFLILLRKWHIFVCGRCRTRLILILIVNSAQQNQPNNNGTILLNVIHLSTSYFTSINIITADEARIEFGCFVTLYSTIGWLLWYATTSISRSFRPNGIYPLVRLKLKLSINQKSPIYSQLIFLNK